MEQPQHDHDRNRMQSWVESQKDEEAPARQRQSRPEDDTDFQRSSGRSQARSNHSRPGLIDQHGRQAYVESQTDEDGLTAHRRRRDGVDSQGSSRQSRAHSGNSRSQSVTSHHEHRPTPEPRDQQYDRAHSLTSATSSHRSRHSRKHVEQPSPEELSRPHSLRSNDSRSASTARFGDFDKILEPNGQRHDSAIGVASSNSSRRSRQSQRTFEQRPNSNGQPDGTTHRHAGSVDVDGSEREREVIREDYGYRPWNLDDHSSDRSSRLGREKGHRGRHRELREVSERPLNPDRSSDRSSHRGGAEGHRSQHHGSGNGSDDRLSKPDNRSSTDSARRSREEGHHGSRLRYESIDDSETRPLIRDRDASQSPHHHRDLQTPLGQQRPKPNHGLLRHLFKFGRLALQANHPDFAKNGPHTAKVLREATEISRPLLEDAKVVLEERTAGTRSFDAKASLMAQGVKWVERKVEEAEKDVRRIERKHGGKGEGKKKRRRRRRKEAGNSGADGGEEGCEEFAPDFEGLHLGDKFVYGPLPAPEKEEDAYEHWSPEQGDRTGRTAGPKTDVDHPSVPGTTHSGRSESQHGDTASRRTHDRRSNTATSSWRGSQSQSQGPLQPQHGGGLAADYYNSFGNGERAVSAASGSRSHGPQPSTSQASSHRSRRPGTAHTDRSARQGENTASHGSHGRRSSIERFSRGQHSHSQASAPPQNGGGLAADYYGSFDDGQRAASATSSRRSRGTQPSGGDASSLRSSRAGTTHSSHGHRSDKGREHRTHTKRSSLGQHSHSHLQAPAPSLNHGNLAGNVYVTSSSENPGRLAASHQASLHGSSNSRTSTTQSSRHHHSQGSRRGHGQRSDAEGTSRGDRAPQSAVQQQMHGGGLAADYYDPFNQDPPSGRRRGRSPSTLRPEDSFSSKGARSHVPSSARRSKTRDEAEVSRENGQRHAGDQGGPTSRRSSRRLSRRASASVGNSSHDQQQSPRAGNTGPIPPPPIGGVWSFGSENGSLGRRGPD